eukprot:gi/632957884/ref/XP_007894729.1/ PREDICTED: transient receptor potential cation channel subfamily V member 3 isoform X2 [Callorhinchus milii]
MIKFRARRELRMMDKNLRVLLATEVDSCTPDPCNEMKIKQRKLQNRVWVDFYRSIAEGDLGEFDKFLQLFQESKTKLTAEWLRDPRTGKTCLMKALLNLNDNTQEMVEKLISFAEASDSLEQLINAEYTDREYKGQTALHIAIERRCKTIVQLLVEKGADINAKAQGRFFKPKKLKHGFYFGELPLSLAACTNQPDIVTLLMASGRTDVRAQDAWGNCILHALVTVADDSEDNTTFVTEMYDMILMSSQDHNLEGICNLRGLNPLQLAAKLGKFKIFSHILCREFKDKKHLNLSRKITDWAYGPVSSSLYDITEVDTNHQNSVLEIVVHNTKIQNRHELLSVEPLNTLLEEKWLTFGAHMFTITCIVYVLYIIGFTTVYYNQAERYQSLISENLTSTTSLQLFGEISSFTAAWVVIIKELPAGVDDCELRRSVLGEGRSTSTAAGPSLGPRLDQHPLLHQRLQVHGNIQCHTAEGPFDRCPAFLIRLFAVPDRIQCRPGLLDRQLPQQPGMQPLPHLQHRHLGALQADPGAGRPADPAACQIPTTLPPAPGRVRGADFRPPPQHADRPDERDRGGHCQREQEHLETPESTDDIKPGEKFAQMSEEEVSAGNDTEEQPRTLQEIHQDK